MEPSNHLPSQALAETENPGVSATPESDLMWTAWNKRTGDGDIEGPGDFCRRKELECQRLRRALEFVKTHAVFPLGVVHLFKPGSPWDIVNIRGEGRPELKGTRDATAK